MKETLRHQTFEASLASFYHYVGDRSYGKSAQYNLFTRIHAVYTGWKGDKLGLNIKYIRAISQSTIMDPSLHKCEKPLMPLIFVGELGKLVPQVFWTSFQMVSMVFRFDGALRVGAITKFKKENFDKRIYQKLFIVAR